MIRWPVPVTLWFAVAVSVVDSCDPTSVRVAVSVTDHGCGVSVTVFDCATAPGGGGVAVNGAMYAT